MKRKVLIITYHFPPRKSVGSNRLKGLAKYLPEFGWEPVILTAKLPAKPDERFRVIETLYPGEVIEVWKRRFGLSTNKGFQETLGVPISIREKRNFIISKIIKMLEGILAFPDNQKYWYKYGKQTGQNILRTESFDAIISSSGPVTCHLIAKSLKNIFNLPWIADFRDLWTQNHYYQYGKLRLFFERQLELKTLASADMLVTVSEPCACDLGVLHKNKTVSVIMSGFDPDEIMKATLTREFTITYTGQLYSGKRDPWLLFKVIKKLILKGKVDKRLVKIRFFGDTEYWLEQEIKHFGLEDIVIFERWVPRHISLEKQRESQILLLLLWDNPKERGTCPAKVFEYLASMRPILALGGQRGVITELLEETKAGIHVLNEEQLESALIDLYKEYESFGHISWKGRKEQINKYSHREMSRKFANLLDIALTKNSN